MFSYTLWQHVYPHNYVDIRPQSIITLRPALSFLVLRRTSSCLVKQHSCYSRQAYCDADDDGCLTSNNKGSLYSITERRVSDLIPVLGSQPAGDTHTHTHTHTPV